MCPVDIFMNIQPFGWNLEWGLFDSSFWWASGIWGQGQAHSIASPWVPIGCPLTHKVFSYRFLSYLAGSKSWLFCPPVHPTVRPGYDDNCRFRSYCFAELQNCLVVSNHLTAEKVLLSLTLVSKTEQLSIFRYWQLFLVYIIIDK